MKSGFARLLLVVVSAGAVLTSQLAVAQTTPAAVPDEPVPNLDQAYLRDPANIKLGQTVWNTQCMHCHGSKAYPGKAPKLKPGGMEPIFVFDRITYGFKAMPPWRDVFTREERKALVAWIKSDEFAP